MAQQRTTRSYVEAPTRTVPDSVYSDSGHGVAFHHREFADAARGLLYR